MGHNYVLGLIQLVSEGGGLGFPFVTHYPIPQDLPLALNQKYLCPMEFFLNLVPLSGRGNQLPLRGYKPGCGFPCWAQSASSSPFALAIVVGFPMWVNWKLNPPILMISMRLTFRQNQDEAIDKTMR